MESKGKLASAIIRSARKAFAAGVALRMQERHPEWVGSHGSFAELSTQNEGLLDHLSMTIEVDRPRLFEAHVAWLAKAGTGQGVGTERLRASLTCLCEEMQEELPRAAAPVAVACIESGLLEFERDRVSTSAPIAVSRPLSELVQRYLELALMGRRANACELLFDALDRGMSATDLRSQVLAAAQVEIGERWQLGHADVGDEHLCSRTTESALGLLASRSARGPRNGLRVLVASVGGDLHEIGPRIVADEFEDKGWSVAFLGANTPAADFVRAAEHLDPHVIAIGAKLTTDLRATLDTIAALKQSERTRRLPLLVGGLPFEIVPDLWRVVGADASAAVADEAVRTATRLVG